MGVSTLHWAKNKVKGQPLHGYTSHVGEGRMDRSISCALEKVGRQTVTLKPEQSECIRYMCSREEGRVSLAANWPREVALLRSTVLRV